MSRYRAFLIHLGISLTIFGALAYLVAEVWYPSFFFLTDGGWQGLRLLLGVDLVLGPLLTLIVYRAGKPGLRFDLTAIGVFQASCLAVGVWIVHGERPIAVVYVDGSFYSVTAESFREMDVPIPDLDQLPGPYPKWVSVKLPDDLDAQSDIRRQMLRSDRMLATLSDRYQGFGSTDRDPREATPLAEIEDRDRDTRALPRWLSEHGGSESDYQFHQFGARYAIAYLGFAAADGRFIGYLATPAPR
jgi:hypothetical protein